MRRETTAKVLQLRMINIAPSHSVVRVFVKGTFGQTGSSKLSSVAVKRRDILIYRLISKLSSGLSIRLSVLWVEIFNPYLRNWPPCLWDFKGHLGLLI